MRRSFVHIPLGMIAGACIADLVALAQGKEVSIGPVLWVILGLAAIGLVLAWRDHRRS